MKKSSTDDLQNLDESYLDDNGDKQEYNTKQQ